MIELMDAVEARALTDRIKAWVTEGPKLLELAYTKQAWEPLGYASWAEYCACEFVTTQLRLPQKERSELVTALWGSGLSERAIAAATGLSKGTVHNELSGGQNWAPDEGDVLAEELITASRPTIGIDGKTYPPRPPKPVDKERERAEQDRLARSDLYSGMGRALSTIGVYGGYDDIGSLMQNYDPAELNPPMIDRYFEIENLQDALHLVTELIEWRKNYAR